MLKSSFTDAKMAGEYMNSKGKLYQGTYGTSYHVDGQAYFLPQPKALGGTMADGNDHSFGDSHCAVGSKQCW